MIQVAKAETFLLLGGNSVTRSKSIRANEMEGSVKRKNSNVNVQDLTPSHWN